MQVEIKKLPPKFVPTTLSLTFETLKELDLFRTTMLYNISIPKLVTYCNEEGEELKHMMSKIGDLLRGL